MKAIQIFSSETNLSTMLPAHCLCILLFSLMAWTIQASLGTTTSETDHRRVQKRIRCKDLETRKERKRCRAAKPKNWCPDISDSMTVRQKGVGAICMSCSDPLLPGLKCLVDAENCVKDTITCCDGSVVDIGGFTCFDGMLVQWAVGLSPECLNCRP